MNVSACLVTRGDVDLEPILASLPMDDVVVWDNSKREDLAVYGRYAAIAEAKHDRIYVQDDDCVLPTNVIKTLSIIAEQDKIVCNMPQPFRRTYYQQHALVGFGAIFHRELPAQAFAKWKQSNPPIPIDVFNRTADVVFTALTPYIMVDLPYSNLSWANGPTRMYRTPGHVEERLRTLKFALKARS